MNYIKILAKNEKEQETLKQWEFYSQDIGMEFRIENVPCRYWKKGKKKQ